jgi:hypothetical protein
MALIQAWGRHRGGAPAARQRDKGSGSARTDFTCVESANRVTREIETQEVRADPGLLGSAFSFLLRGLLSRCRPALPRLPSAGVVIDLVLLFLSMGQGEIPDQDATGASAPC